MPPNLRVPAVAIRRPLHTGITKPKSKPRPTLPATLSPTCTDPQTTTSYRWETPEPTAANLSTAVKFFTRIPPCLLWTEARFKDMAFGHAPEVAFLGRSNVGKSSLLNALLGRTLAFTSSKPGRTTLLNAYAVSGGKGVLLDMPGYGHNSRSEWGVQVMKYLESRRGFRRAFLLVDAKHGFKSADLAMVRTFADAGVPFQVVLSKVDRLRPGEAAGSLVTARQVLEGGGDERRVSCGLGEIIGTAANPGKKRARRVGINELRWSIMVAMGFDTEGFVGGSLGQPTAGKGTMAEGLDGARVDEGQDEDGGSDDDMDDDEGGISGGGIELIGDLLKDGA